MTARNARFVANTVVIAAGATAALLVWRQPSVRRAALRAMPLVLGGAPLWQVAAFLLARGLGDRPHEPVAASSEPRPRDPLHRVSPG